jgi:hypothetical protein
MLHAKYAEMNMTNALKCEWMARRMCSTVSNVPSMPWRQDAPIVDARLLATAWKLMVSSFVVPTAPAKKAFTILKIV